MQRLTQIYTTKLEFLTFLENSDFDLNTLCVVKIFTSSLSEDEISVVAKDIKESLPSSTIIGSTSCISVVMHGEQHDFSTLVIIETYDHLQLNVHTFSYLNKTAKELAQEICTTYEGETSLIHTIFSDPYADIHDFTEHVNHISPKLSLAGGVAGDLSNLGRHGYVFTEDGAINHGILTFCHTGSGCHSFSHTSTSMQSISEVYQITKMNGSIIEEIENTKGIDWICDFLNLTNEKTVSDDLMSYTETDWKSIAQSDYLSHFPILIEQDNSCYISGRYTQYLSDIGELSLYYSKLPTSTKFRIGYLNPDSTVYDSYKLCEKIIDTPAESMFVYTCLFRKLQLQNCAKWELRPFEKYNVCGIFMMGEISNVDGKNVFFNGAAVFTTLAEQDKYMLPNITALENVSLLRDDISFVQKAKDTGKSLLKQQNKNIIDKINAVNNQNKDSIEKLFLDSTTQLPTFYQFETDKSKLNLTKICLAENITADTIIATSGIEEYNNLIREMLGVTADNFEKTAQITFPSYLFNYKTFILACDDSISDDDFIGYMKDLHEKFEYYTKNDLSVTAVSRFIVVTNQQDLVDVAINALSVNKDLQDNFIICNGDTKIVESSENDIYAINLLSGAIANNSVIPFYQGIYNNRTNKIDKYEALMRIIDQDGKVISPFFFMEASKTYKFYHRISRMMIDKALTDFENRSETLSINVSLYDIESSQFRSWLVKRLKKHTNPSGIVIEFVETENYQNLDLLFEFITSVRALGAQIAVDDFGSGYSTFSTIVALKPDYIKIDGSIVSKIVDNHNNSIILKSIVNLSNQMNTQTIAEFVENAEIQQTLLGFDVDYSQGYYFSKPMSFADTFEIK